LLRYIFLIRRPLWREDGSIIYSRCWAWPAQSFSGLSATELVTTFYCVNFESPPTWRARTEWPCYPPGTPFVLYGI
jgi:hypothetical protein